jgi:hypothetical protein
MKEKTMAQRVRKITPEVLKQIIVQEARKLRMEAAQEDADHPEDVDAHELKDASGYADTLGHHIDHYKALKIHEARLKAKLAKIQEAKSVVQKKIARNR